MANADSSGDSNGSPYNFCPRSAFIVRSTKGARSMLVLAAKSSYSSVVCSSKKRNSVLAPSETRPSMFLCIKDSTHMADVCDKRLWLDADQRLRWL